MLALGDPAAALARWVLLFPRVGSDRQQTGCYFRPTQRIVGHPKQFLLAAWDSPAMHLWRNASKIGQGLWRIFVEVRRRTGSLDDVNSLLEKLK